MSAPLHERIRGEIEAGILSGALAPGARLPVEHELMRAHGCSRMTVNKALSALAAAGLIERRKGAGSFVARPRAHAMVLDVPDLAAEIEGRGQRYAFRLLDRALAPARGGEARTVAGAARVLTVRGVHLADDVPLAVERRLVNADAVPEIAEEDFAAISPGGWLIRHVPWTEAENRIVAQAADTETAALLGIAAGTACLLIERRTWRGGEGITHVRQIFRGDGYELVARFGASGG